MTPTILSPRLSALSVAIAGAVALSFMALVFSLATAPEPPPPPGAALPFARGADPISDTPDQVVLSVLSDGTSWLGHRWFPASALPQALKAAIGRSPRARVLLRVDRALAFSRVRTALSTLSEAGARRVTLVVTEPEPPHSPAHEHP